MATEALTSESNDPFHNYSLLSLFPRTFKLSPDHSHTSNQTDDIDYIHNRLTSMARENPDRFLEQANMVVDASSSLVNSNLTTGARVELKKNGDAAKDEENQRGHRPGLGVKRERAHFDFKLNLSQETVSSQPNLDMDKVASEIDKVQDPYDFFLAHKRLELAKKEIQRQMGGVSTDLKERNSPAAAQPRQRRPGLFGAMKSTGRFKEVYSQILPETDEAILSSQDVSEQVIPCSFNAISLQENSVPNKLLGEREDADNKVDELFNELLSTNPEDLEGDRAIALLQERLQIKPITIDKFCLPDLHEIPKFDFKASIGNLLKPRKLISSCRAKLEGILSPIPAKQRQDAENSAVPIATPTPPKSPFAAISLLKRRISQSNSSYDPFSPRGIDLAPAKNPSPIGSFDKQFDEEEMNKSFSNSKNLNTGMGLCKEGTNDLAPAKNPSPIRSFDKQFDQEEMNKSFINSKNLNSGMGLCKEGANNLTRSINKYVNEYSNAHDHGKDVHSDVFHGGFEANDERENGNEDVTTKAAESRSCVPHPNISANTQNNVEDKAGDMLQGAAAFAEPAINNDDLSLEDVNTDQPRPDIIDQSVVPSENPDAEEDNEKISEISSTSFDNNQGETHPHPELNVHCNVAKQTPKKRKRKEMSRRQSLAAAGTNWESGVRRSTRIKMRPLEYWKGERFLYGRIHESLTTVIGVKYASPAKGSAEPFFKVKSYVSDQYNDLVDLAALH